MGPAIHRFVRVVIAAAVAGGLKAALENIAGLGLPIFVVPIVGAALNAVAKWLRDKYGIDIQIV